MFTISFVVRGLDWLRLESERIIGRFSNGCRKTKTKAITVITFDSHLKTALVTIMIVVDKSYS